MLANRYSITLFIIVLSLLFDYVAISAALDRIIVEVATGSLAEKNHGESIASVECLSTGDYGRFIGKGAIWQRGSSSSTHPKKSYRLEFQDENGNDLKKPFC